MNRIVFLLALLLPAAAFAVPRQLSHQGFLTDGGSPLTGTVEIEFSLWTADQAGDSVWDETHEVDVVAGRYSVLLGNDEPITDDVLARPVLYLQIAVDGETLAPRQSFVAVPYARVSGGVQGGVVDADEVRVGGDTVIDGDGNWVGPGGPGDDDDVVGPVDWGDLVGVPAGFADDVDNDALGGMSCASGARPVWTGSMWDCAPVSWSELDGVPAGFADGTDSDAMAGLTCPGAGRPRWTGTSWTCDAVGWSELGGVPGGFLDGTDNDALGGLSCVSGARPRWTGSAWTCDG